MAIPSALFGNTFGTRNDGNMVAAPGRAPANLGNVGPASPPGLSGTNRRRSRSPDTDRGRSRRRTDASGISVPDSGNRGDADRGTNFGTRAPSPPYGKGVAPDFGKGAPHYGQPDIATQIWNMMTEMWNSKGFGKGVPHHGMPSSFNGAPSPNMEATSKSRLCG